MFHVGQKVVCVDSDSDTYEREGDPDMDGLRRGAIYTIRWSGAVHHAIFGDYPGVFLHEIVRPHCPNWRKETPYHAGRFRPVTERKTDISVFEEIRKRASKELVAVDD